MLLIFRILIIVEVISLWLWMHSCIINLWPHNQRIEKQKENIDVSSGTSPVSRVEMCWSMRKQVRAVDGKIRPDRVKVCACRWSSTAREYGRVWFQPVMFMYKVMGPTFSWLKQMMLSYVWKRLSLLFMHL